MNKEDTNTLTPTTHQMHDAASRYIGGRTWKDSTELDVAIEAHHAGWNAHASLTDEWIPVDSGKLPEEREPVLVYTASAIDDTKQRTAVRQGTLWYSPAGRSIHVAITHWRKLPTPPKVVGAGGNSDV